MSYFELRLEEFLFPKKLNGDQANFRFIVDVRFTNDQDQYTTEQAIMPGPDTFWECDPDKKKDPNYIRDSEDKNLEIDGNTYECSQFHKEDFHEWDRLILLLKGKSLHSILFTVYNVDREDIWDKMQKIGERIFEAVFSKIGKKITDSIPENLSSYLPDSLGGADDDLRSFLLKKIAGSDKSLFRRSVKLEVPTAENSKEFTIQGRGTQGKYQIVFSVENPQDKSVIEDKDEGYTQRDPSNN